MTENKTTGLRTGFSKLGNLTLGFKSGELVVLRARLGMGKTSFLISIAKNMAIDFNYSITFFSLEIEASQLENRMLCFKTLENKQS